MEVEVTVEEDTSLAVAFPTCCADWYKKSSKIKQQHPLAKLFPSVKNGFGQMLTEPTQKRRARIVIPRSTVHHLCEQRITKSQNPS